MQLFPAGAEKPLVAKLQLELEFQRELQKKRQADQEYTDLFNRATFLYAKSDLAAALKLFQEAEQQRPNDPAAVYNQAVIYEKLGDFAKAVERYRRYAELESDADAKAAIDQRIFALDSRDRRHEDEDRLPVLRTASADRRDVVPALLARAVSDDVRGLELAAVRRRRVRDARDVLRRRPLQQATTPAVPLQHGTMLESLRYTPARQRAIQDARKAEGWTYSGEIIQG